MIVKKFKIKKIRKRNGRIVEFNQEKITQAIEKAIIVVEGKDGKQSKKLSDKVLTILEYQFDSKIIPTVEEIQDVVEKVLIKAGLVDVAKSYILYRKEREKMREMGGIMMDIKKIIDDYLKQEDWRVKENANIGYSFGGLMLHISGSVIANYLLENIYSTKITKAHKEGDLHLHDLYMGLNAYCAGWSLRQLLLQGLGGVKNRIECAPPKHLETLLGQMVNFWGILQNEWAGAQAFSSFDTYLAPFVRADNLTYKQVKQNIQKFMFNIAAPSRWGAQTPFTNLTFDWTVPEDLKNDPVIIGGKLQETTYSDYQKEMDMINRAFIEVAIEGDNVGRVFTFPIPTYNITKDFNWDSSNANLLFEMTAKYGLPYFQNFINSELKPTDVRSMCCRLQMNLNQLRAKTGGLFGSGESTGSVGVVTINMPRIGYLAKTKKDFFDRLTEIMNLAKESLEIKRKVVTHNLNNGLFPYTKRYLGNLDHHFSTIGPMGMNEACLNFLGKDKGIASKEGKEFSLEVLDFMREKLKEFQKETGNIYNLEATPAEGTSYRLAKIDKKEYPKIITAGEKIPYYTNSTHLPASYTDDIFEALDFQDELQCKYTGGTVFHGFVGEKMPSVEATKKLVKRIAENYRLPYFTITPTFSICPNHGYISGEHFKCSQCKKECEVYSRVVGYIRPIQQWNAGKQEEFKNRKEYKV
jgi:ribonucleoside-triphosphate reductase